MTEFTIGITAPAFFASAFALRTILQHHLESRYQIAGFCILAAALESGRYYLAGRASVATGFSNAICAVVAILIVKFLIEYTAPGIRWKKGHGRTNHSHRRHRLSERT